MSAPSTYDFEHKGWAPCFCGSSDKTPAESEAERRQWLASAAPDAWAAALAEGIGGHGLTEHLLWELGLIGAVSCVADQWVRVVLTGRVSRPDAPEGHLCGVGCGVCSVRFRITIQGDDFALALAEAYRVWRELEQRVEGGGQP